MDKEQEPLIIGIVGKRTMSSEFLISDSEMAPLHFDLFQTSMIHQVLHRPQNKERPMQNNFEAPVWQLKMVFECSIAWCDLGLGRAIVHCQRNHLRKPKFSRNRTVLSDHFSGVNFYTDFFISFFSTVRCSWRSSVLRGFR